MKLYAHAKINLYLDVLGRLPDGFHLVKSVMQSITLSDVVSIYPAKRTQVVCPERPEICDEANFAFKAAEAFKARVAAAKGLEVAIEISKRIPIAAGLAGGSADAAAAIVGMNEISGAGLSSDELAEIGELVGMDVPFCIVGGTMLAEGRGERLSPLRPMPNAEIVLVTLPAPLSTARVYSALDQLNVAPLNGIDAVLSALKDGNLEDLARALDNRLAVAAISLVPEIEGVLSSLRSVGALGATVSGSGPTAFGIFRPGEGELAAEQLRSAYPDSFVAFALPTRRGIDIADRDCRWTKPP